ncbi:hypothetical protein NUW54_g14390 [Trametes sanguinea]|uniref:Uncharacterized protein n=1 Tax=Trametes sanguinea TaxID=158606 RepID=A0ACC1MCJ0_9APHY|nr:hypothetical protein NUW54_g14390 [Trametes sanguinea]
MSMLLPLAPDGVYAYPHRLVARRTDGVHGVHEGGVFQIRIPTSRTREREHRMHHSLSQLRKPRLHARGPVVTHHTPRRAHQHHRSRRYAHEPRSGRPRYALELGFGNAQRGAQERRDALRVRVRRVRDAEVRERGRVPRDVRERVAQAEVAQRRRRGAAARARGSGGLLGVADVESRRSRCGDGGWSVGDAADPPTTTHPCTHM